MIKRTVFYQQVQQIKRIERRRRLELLYDFCDELIKRTDPNYYNVKTNAANAWNGFIITPKAGECPMNGNNHCKMPLDIIDRCAFMQRYRNISETEGEVCCEFKWRK